MLDIKYVRLNFESIKKMLEQRGEGLTSLDEFETLDMLRRELIVKAEDLKAKRNVVTKEIALLKKEKKDASDQIFEMRTCGDEIKEIDDQLRLVEAQLNDMLLKIPNIPHHSTPLGHEEEDNVEVRTWGEVKQPPFVQKPHWEIGTEQGILDFEKASKVTGSRFVFYKGLGARLERALINYMMDLHADEHGYVEMLPPYIVNRQSMTGTGQLPKFEEDAFKIADRDYFLVPTAEVPVTNYYRDDIIDHLELPQKFVAYSASFRSEAGSAGRDTRGLIRQHQFNKVELVQFCKPEESYDRLEELTNHAEKILQRLALPYRVVSICMGDLGFTAAKKYDLEVWMPSNNTYREISSCSNFEDFQARRSNIRFRREEKGKLEFVHTLNGSGLAIGRTVAAILENYQNEDGSVNIPTVLQPYMNGVKVIANKK